MGVSLLISAGIALIYLLVVFGAQYDDEVLDVFLGKVNVVAHKGYSSKAPENTMSAFELAVDFLRQVSLACGLNPDKTK